MLCPCELGVDWPASPIECEAGRFLEVYPELRSYVHCCPWNFLLVGVAFGLAPATSIARPSPLGASH
jgi:hypothetical protein